MERIIRGFLKQGRREGSSLFRSFLCYKYWFSKKQSNIIGYIAEKSVKILTLLIAKGHLMKSLFSKCYIYREQNTIITEYESSGCYIKERDINKRSFFIIIKLLI